MMTRKEFLQAVGGAAAFAAIPQSPDTTAAPKANLRRGVSLYSYQEEFYTRAMTLEDCLAEASSIGARAIELLPEEMVPDFPAPSTQWIAQWHTLLDKYGLAADTYCQFQDTILTKGNDLTTDQGLEMLERDLKLAKRMGFKNMRLLIGTPIEVIEKGLALAEKYGVWMGSELHAPVRLDGPLVRRWLKIIEDHKTEHYGFIPDFGIFQKRVPRVQRDRLIRDGQLMQAVAKYVEAARESGTPKTQVQAEVAKMGGGAGDKRYVEMVYNARMEDPRLLVQMRPYIRHFHAKFYEMTEDFREYSIPYEEVIPILIQAGFDASLASEYEGQRHTQDAFETDSCEQVRRQQVMLRRLLGELG